jgi:Fic family protein
VRESIAKTPFKLRPSQILRLNRVAILGLSPYPGVYRPDEMKIGLSRHNPPPPEMVPALMEEMCDYVNENLNKPPYQRTCFGGRTGFIHSMMEMGALHVPFLMLS